MWAVPFCSYFGLPGWEYQRNLWKYKTLFLEVEGGEDWKDFCCDGITKENEVSSAGWIYLCKEGDNLWKLQENGKMNYPVEILNMLPNYFPGEVILRMF